MISMDLYSILLAQDPDLAHKKKVPLMPETAIEHKTLYTSLHTHKSTEQLYLVLNTTVAN
jgi:hypothetical protein